MEEIKKQIADLTTIVMNGQKDVADLTTIVMNGQKDLADLTNLVTTGFQDLYTHLDNIENNMDSGFSYLKGEVRDLRADIKSLQETNIPHAEYEEIRQRLLRIEDKLGLPHELSTT